MDHDYEKLKHLAEQLGIKLSDFNEKDWGYDGQLIWGINRKRLIIHNRRVIVLNLGWLGSEMINKLTCDFFPELKGVSFNNNQLEDFNFSFLCKNSSCFLVRTSRKYFRFGNFL